MAGTAPPLVEATSSGGPGRRLGHVLVRLILLVLVLVGAGGLLTAGLFIWPPSAAVQNSDAVVVLSGDHGERLPRALQLIGEGATSTLVLAGEPDSWSAQEMCDGGEPYEVICPRPHPDGTRPEARAVAELAKSRHWRSIAIVTSTQHVTRAGLLFRRCFPGRVTTIGVRPPFDFRTRMKAIEHEWLALIHALVISRHC